jgi:RimJ/RimL family protein N-acetyltransferase
VIEFRPFTRPDFPLLLDWLGREHVRRWWYDEPTTLDGLEAEYGPSLDGRDPTDHFLILLDGRPIGFIQSYRAADYAEVWPVDAPPGAVGVDLLIGEEGLTGSGLGPEILRLYAARLFEDPEVTQVVAGVELENERSLRAFEKAGFVPAATVQVGDARAPERLMTLHRQ